MRLRKGWQRSYVRSVRVYQESKTQPSKSTATSSPPAPNSDTPPAASNLSASVACHCTPNLNAQGTGWDAMERALDGFDKQQVEDYKDDIDTLLVFAGLYSAVLTAFVIESYPLLQEDTAGESLQALRQIASQSAGYVIMGGQLVNTTATVPSASLSQFEPTPAAVRLNVLWFASLVLSLSTASLGIMVKQWLREYVAFATSSAQGNLRVRAFRRSGLDTWQVFGIASILPLLLQLSLLFFFVGLCYFTANIHPSVQNTTLPLVCAWGFLILSAILAPVFSARCPYKTPGLKPMTTAIRVRVYQPIAVIALSLVHKIAAGLMHCIARTPLHSTEQPALNDLDIFLRINALQQQIGEHNELIRTMLNGALEQTWKRTAESFCRVVGNQIPSVPPASESEDHDEEVEAELIEETHSIQPLEESEIVKDASNDLDILASADALQANDELLGTTVKAALEQSQPTWEKTVEFLLKVMGNRIPGVPLVSDDPTLIDSRSLSVRARQALQDILALDVLNAVSLEWFHSDVEPHDSDKRRAASWVIHLYVSLFQDSAQMTGSHSRLFLECVVGEGTAIYSIICRAKSGKRLRAWVLALACQVCRGVDDTDLVNGFLLLTETIRLVGPLDTVDYILALPEESLQVLFEQLHRMTTLEASLQLEDSSPDRECLAHAVCFVLELYGTTHIGETSFDWDRQLASLGPKLYTSKLRTLLPSFLHGCILQNSTYILENIWNRQKTLWGLTCADYNAEAIARLEEALEWLSSHHILTPLSTSEALALCSIIARLVTTCTSHGFGFDSPVHPWRPIFNILADLLRKSVGWHDNTSCIVCWVMILKIDEAWFQPSSASEDGLSKDEAWLHRFKESDSAVGDYFCLALKRFTGLLDGDLDGHSWRARRLSDMSDLEREELERRGEDEAHAERESRRARRLKKD